MSRRRLLKPDDFGVSFGNVTSEHVEIMRKIMSDGRKYTIEMLFEKTIRAGIPKAGCYTAACVSALVNAGAYVLVIASEGGWREPYKFQMRGIA